MMFKVTFTLLLLFSSFFSYSQLCNDLFISEIVFGKIAALDGVGQENYSVEIFNPTDNAINLNQYQLDLFSETNSKTTINLNGFVASHQTHVISYSSSGTGILNASDALSPSLTLDDYVLLELTNGEMAIDAVGKAGTSTDISQIDLEALLADPENYLANLNINLRSIENLVIRRSPAVQKGVTSFEAIDLLQDWKIYPHFFIDNLGLHQNACVAPFLRWKGWNPSAPESMYEEGVSTDVNGTVEISGGVDNNFTINLVEIQHEYSNPPASNANIDTDLVFDGFGTYTILATNEGLAEQEITIGQIVDDTEIEETEGIGFYMLVFDDNGTGASAAFEVLDISIEDNDVSAVKNHFPANHQIKAYPAVFTDFITLESTNETQTLESILVYNATGQLVGQQQWSPSIKQVIDLSSITSSGYHTLVIKTSKGLATKQVIKY